MASWLSETYPVVIAEKCSRLALRVAKRLTSRAWEKVEMEKAVSAVHYAPENRTICGSDSPFAMFTEDRSWSKGCAECLEAVNEDQNDAEEYIGRCLSCLQEIRARGGIEWRRVVRAPCSQNGQGGW